jgi:hypothetical protein
MLKLKQKIASKQAAQRLAAIGRRKLKLYRATKGEPVVPARVLKKLAALNLPPNKWVYSVCMEALLRNSSSSLGLVSVSHDGTRAAASAMDDGSAAVDGYSGCRAVLTTARENF